MDVVNTISEITLLPRLVSKTISSYNYKSSYDYILGPVSLYELQSQDKHIYLFGDYHAKLSTCSNSGSESWTYISEFIRNTIELNPNETIDIFLEGEFLTKTKQTKLDNQVRTNYLYDVKKNFEECLQFNKQNCPFPNARFHYVDVRLLGSGIMYTLDNMYLTLHYGILDDSQSFAKLYSEQYSYSELDEIKFDLTSESFIKQILEETKILKQLKNIQDPEIRNKVHTYFVSKLKNTSFIITDTEINYYKYYILFLKSINKNNTTAENRYLKNKFALKDFDFILYSLMGKILDYTCILLDFYTVSRILRHFNSENRFNSNSPKNIIVYAGNDHIQNMMKFFYEELNFRLVNYQNQRISGNELNQCLDIKKFRQPFFSTQFVPKRKRF